MPEGQEWFAPGGIAQAKIWERDLSLSPNTLALTIVNQKRLVYRIKDDIKQILFPEPTEEDIEENGPFADINPYLPDDVRRCISGYINLFVKRGVLSYFDIVELVSTPSEFRIQIFIEHKTDKANWASEFTVNKRFDVKS